MDLKQIVEELKKLGYNPRITVLEGSKGRCLFLDVRLGDLEPKETCKQLGVPAVFKEV